MPELLMELLVGLREYPLLTRDAQLAWRRRVEGLSLAWPDDAVQLLSQLARDGNVLDATLDEPIAALISRLECSREEAARRVWTAELLEHVTTLVSYRLAATPMAQFRLLRTLAESDEPVVLGCWAKLAEHLSPIDAKHVDASLTPFFQRRSYDPEAIFPALLEALRFPSLATGVLDLANFLFRSGRCSQHPAAERVQQLASLLGGVAHRLQCLAEQPAETKADLAIATRILQESSGLVVSLCDALALIGDASVIGKLNQVMELKHRRLRTEAACALARLGDSSGVRALVQLAREPVVRSRALAYLDEVGALDEAPAELRSSVARGEGELAAWLAAPEQFGLAPQALELVESKWMHWPGNDEPVECHLFRFEYALPRGGFSGIGIAGPATHALGVDLLDYPPADIFAIYCGWQAEHAELRETDASDISAAQRATADRTLRRMIEQGYDRATLIKVGQFFGEEHFVFEADRVDGAFRQSGVAVVDGGDIAWYAKPHSSNPPSEREIYWLHRGRKLLAYFNARH